MTTTQTPPIPTLTPRKPPRGFWAVLWLAVGAVLVVLLMNHAALDTRAWLATRWFVGDRGTDPYKYAEFHAAHLNDAGAAFYVMTPPPFESHFYAQTEWLWEAIKFLGNPWFTTIVIAAIGIFSKRRLIHVPAGVTATAFAGGLSALLRIIDGRVRPHHTDGANTWVLFRGFYDGKDLSFPSGHATLAFATAAVVVYLWPRWAWAAIPLAAICAASRVVMGAHFWSDVIMGGAMGYTIAWFVMHFLETLAARQRGQSAGKPAN